MSTVLSLGTAIALKRGNAVAVAVAVFFSISRRLLAEPLPPTPAEKRVRKYPFCARAASQTTFYRPPEQRMQFGRPAITHISLHIIGGDLYNNMGEPFCGFPRFVQLSTLERRTGRTTRRRPRDRGFFAHERGEGGEPKCGSEGRTETPQKTRVIARLAGTVRRGTFGF